jgi:hypothetical protein
MSRQLSADLFVVGHVFRGFWTGAPNSVEVREIIATEIDDRGFGRITYRVLASTRGERPGATGTNALLTFRAGWAREHLGGETDTLPALIHTPTPGQLTRVADAIFGAAK